MNIRGVAGNVCQLLMIAALGANQANQCQGQDRPATPSGHEAGLPSFAAATIKLSAPGAVADAQWSRPGGSEFRATNVSLQFLTTMAYGIDAKQLKGAPSWFGSVHFDLNAKAEPGVELSREALRPRLQELLARRFHLKMHHETMDERGFVLVVAKHGSKLISSKGDQPPNFRVDVGPGKLKGSNWSMEFCALMLTPKVGMPVVDRTGIQGRYDIDVEYDADMSPDSLLPSLDAAIQQRLGLTLVAQKVPVDMIVIDQVDQVPTDN
jgi:uncharacterized protein (TIGR03435 family)